MNLSDNICTNHNAKVWLRDNCDLFISAYLSLFL